MEKANGSAKWEQLKELFPDMREEFANNEADKSAASKKPKQRTSPPPAMAFTHGRIMTRVWANPNHWGDISWKVDQARQLHSGMGNYSRSYCPEDLQDAMRGMYAAKRWIKNAERRSRRRWFW